MLFVSSSSYEASGTSHTVTLPSSGAERDLLIAVGIDSGGTVATWTSPAGWNEVFDASGRFVSWRLTAASEANPAFTSSLNTSVLIYLIRYRFSAFDVVGTLSAGATPTVAPAITLSQNNSSVIGFFTNRGASISFTTPTDYTLIASNSNATAPSGTVFRRDNLPAGTTGTVSSTPNSPNVGLGLLVGLKPLT